MAKRTSTEKIVDMDQVAHAIAKTVADGDIVNFRGIFLSYSPARTSSPEALDTAKYNHFAGSEEFEQTDRFKQALALVQNKPIWDHITGELAANRPSQLPWEPLMLLADNAVRLGKYSSAGQAYEQLRMRRKMQELFFEQGLAFVSDSEIPKAVRAFRIGAGLGYDYAAFPEPLPNMPKHASRGLILHGTYPSQPEDCVALLNEEAHCVAIVQFVLDCDEASESIQAIPAEHRNAFLKELILQSDPNWDQFAERYQNACGMVEEFAKRMHDQNEGTETLKSEIEEQQGHRPEAIMSTLLGRTLEGGEWWQYIKELAYSHPAGVLFITRQWIGDHEILMPRLRGDSKLPELLGLVPR
jgi:hypothetical protein